MPKYWLMWLFFTFVLLSYLAIYVPALLHILFCLICQNLLILKNGLIKKFKLGCSQQVFVLSDWRFTESSSKASIFIIFREISWLETRRWKWEIYQFIVGATLISIAKKTRCWKEYLSSVNCSFTEMSKNARIRKR